MFGYKKKEDKTPVSLDEAIRMQKVKNLYLPQFPILKQMCGMEATDVPVYSRIQMTADPDSRCGMVPAFPLGQNLLTLQNATIAYNQKGKPTLLDAGDYVRVSRGPPPNYKR